MKKGVVSQSKEKYMSDRQPNGGRVESQQEYFGTSTGRLPTNKVATTQRPQYDEGIANAKKRARKAIIKELLSDLYGAIEDYTRSYPGEPATPMSAIYVRAKAFCEEFEEQEGD